MLFAPPSLNAINAPDAFLWLIETFLPKPNQTQTLASGNINCILTNRGISIFKANKRKVFWNGCHLGVCPQDSCTLSCLTHKPHFVQHILLSVCPKLSCVWAGYQSRALCELRTNHHHGASRFHRNIYVALSLCDAHASMWSSQPAECLCVVFDVAPMQNSCVVWSLYVAFSVTALCLCHTTQATIIWVSVNNSQWMWCKVLFLWMCSWGPCSCVSAVCGLAFLSLHQRSRLGFYFLSLLLWFW